MKSCVAVSVVLLTMLLVSCGGGGDTVVVQPSPEALAAVAPKNLIAKIANNQVTLEWNAVDGAESYNIYWKNSSKVTLSDNKISEATSPHVHSDVASGVSYYYAVTSVRSGIESALSEEVYAILGAKIAFVSSASGNGNFSTWPEAGGKTGVEAGDAICNYLASRASLSGTFKALVASGSTKVQDRLTTNGPWARVDGVIVFPSKSESELMAPLEHFNLTEKNTNVTNDLIYKAWTGVYDSVYPEALTCSEWTSESESEGGKDLGEVGLIGSTEPYWLIRGPAHCNEQNRIYCFED